MNTKQKKLQEEEQRWEEERRRRQQQRLSLTSSARRNNDNFKDNDDTPIRLSDIIKKPEEDEIKPENVPIPSDDEDGFSSAEDVSSESVTPVVPLRGRHLRKTSSESLNTVISSHTEPDDEIPHFATSLGTQRDEEDSNDENGALSAEDDDEGSDDSDSDPSLPAEVRLQKVKSKLSDTKLKMRSLISNIEEYKNFLEIEKTNIEKKMSQQNEELQIKNDDLTKEVESLQQSNEDLRTTNEQLVEEYEAKLATLTEDRKTRTKENVENLQTLIKELTYIEEMNQTLSAELEKEKEEHAKTIQELQLSKELILEYERKIARQNEAAISGAPLSADVSELQQQLLAEKKKIETILSLVGQIRYIANPDPSLSGREDAVLAEKLREEQEHHLKTKDQLREERQKAKEDKETIQKLQKRIKDLIHTHTNTLQQIGSNPEPPKAELSSTPKKKKESELTLEEKIQQIFNCVETGKYDDMTKLVKKTKGIIHATDSVGASMLHKAVLYASPPYILKFLLENGVEINLQDNRGWGTLHYAAKSPIDNSDALKFLLKRNEINANVPDNDKNFPIHFYAKSKFINMEVFSLLVSKTAEINVQNAAGDTPLHYTCSENHDAAALHLLKNGGNPNIQNAKGETCLHYAARIGSIKICQLLLEHNADAYIQGNQGTPYEVAAPLEAIKELLQPRKRVTVAVPVHKSSEFKKPEAMAQVASLTRARSSTSDIKTMTVSINGPNITLKTNLHPTATVKEALAQVRKKFPENMSNYVLYVSNIRLDENKKISDYPQIKEKKELVFQSADYIKGKDAKSNTLNSSKASKIQRDLAISQPILAATSSNNASRSISLTDVRKKTDKRATVANIKDLQELFSTMPQTITEDDIDETKVIVIQLAIKQHNAFTERRRLQAAAARKKSTIQEIFHAENVFLKTLEQVFLNWVQPISSSDQLPKKAKEAISKLFTNLQIIMKCSQKMIEMLKPLVSDYNYKIRIGQLFLNIDPSLRNYSYYTESYYESYPILEDKKFISYIMKVPGVTEPIASSMTMWLHAPIAHINTIRKYLSSLESDTCSEHIDYSDIQKALSLVNGITKEFTQAEKLRMNQEEISRIENKFVGNPPFLKLPGRFFIREGELIRNQKHSSKPRYIVLFSDCILFGEHVPKSQNLKFLEIVELRPDAQVKDNNDKGGKGFTVTIPGVKDPVILIAESANEKESWIRILSSVISDLKESYQSLQDKKPSPANSFIKPKNETPSTPPPAASSPSPQPSQASISSPPMSPTQQFGEKRTFSVRWGKSNTQSKANDVPPDVCAVCLSKFGVTKRKVECKKCGKNVCKNCTTKLSGSRVCKICVTKLRATDSVRLLNLFDLPDKILMKICAYIPIKELINILLINKRFNQLGEGNVFWKTIYKNNWRHRIETTDGAVGNYRTKCIVETNWERGRSSVLQLKGHGASISSLKFHGSILISGSVDTTMKIWNMDSMECLATLKGHTSTVRCIEYAPKLNMIMSVSDNAVKLWDIQTAKLIHSVKPHSTEISAIQYDSERNVLITASDKSVKVIDLGNYNTVQTMSGHKSKIYCFQARKNMMVTGSKNSISIWDINQDRCLNTLKGHADVVRCVTFDSKTVVSGSDDMTIKVFEKDSGEYTLEGHKGKVQCLQMDKNKIVSGSTDATIKIWSLQNKKCLCTLQQPDAGWVRCLQFNDDGLLVSGHGDSIIRLWNFQQ